MKNKLGLYFIIFFFCFGLVQADDVFAHKIKIFAFQDGDEINGTVYFPGGGKAHNVKVLVFDEKDNQLGQVVTDENGKFSYLPKEKGEHVFITETLDGHKATFTVISQGSAQPEDKKIKGAQTEAKIYNEPKINPGDIENIVSRQLAPLKRQMEEYEQNVRLRDIIGAIGYIFGIMGLWALFIKQKDKKT
jgi:nickel transport protein